MTDDLSCLADLHASGALTDAEYTAAKASVLGVPQVVDPKRSEPLESGQIVDHVLKQPSGPRPKSAALLEAEKESRQHGQIVSGALVLLTVLAFMWMCNACGSSDEVEQPTTPATSSPSLSTGDAVRLRLPASSSPLLVATTEEAFDRLTDALSARDSYGITELVASGQAFSVEAGTEAILLDPGFLKSRVRVTAGPMTGQSGWVAREFATAR